MTSRIDFTYQPYIPTTPVDMGFAQEYFNTLPENERNQKYYNGLVYELPTTYFARQANKLTLGWKINTLHKFYPYQKMVTKTLEQMAEDRKQYAVNSLFATAAAWTFIFQYAKKGAVFPMLKEYGFFLRTHRIFRQYAYSLLFPPIVAVWYFTEKYNDHIELMWKTHANRLNQKILSDPVGSEYPEQIRSPLRRIVENNYI